MTLVGSIRVRMGMVIVMRDVGIDIQFCTIIIIIIIRIIQLRHLGRWRLCHVVVDLCVLFSIGAAKMYGTSIAGQSSWENPEKISLKQFGCSYAARVRFETDVSRTVRQLQIYLLPSEQRF